VRNVLAAGQTMIRVQRASAQGRPNAWHTQTQALLWQELGAAIPLPSLDLFGKETLRGKLEIYRVGRDQ